MPYPESPFPNDFNNDLIIPGGSNVESKAMIIKELKRWLCKTPSITSIRINPNQSSLDKVINVIETYLKQIYTARNIKIPRVYKHENENLQHVIVVEHLPVEVLDLQLALDKEIIVDHLCAAAVLRGAHIFAPGVIGMTKDCRIGDKVSIYADTSIKGRCRKGFAKVWHSPGKVFIANGNVKMSREQLFTNATTIGSSFSSAGLAIEITATISGSPPLDSSLLLQNGALLQNIPSVVCVEVLDPQPHETVLDMCASPGGKTSHIAVKMNNTGILVAIDRTPGKVAQLNRTCSNFQCSNVRTFVADSTKICMQNQQYIEDGGDLTGPPFRPQSFDRILLDAPCSASGNRPQLLNKDSEAVLTSFIPLQRKLIQTAYELLKVNGILVYSTCSVAIPENEGIVAWALKNFKLDLVECEPRVASGGFSVEGISNPGALQRFGPSPNGNDDTSIGFFIARFKKR